MDKKNIASEQTPEEKKDQGTSPSLLSKLKKRKKTPSQLAENVQRYAPRTGAPVAISVRRHLRPQYHRRHRVGDPRKTQAG